MADQAPAAASSGKPQEFVDPTSSGSRFPPKGQPLITGFNRIGLWSLYMKEVRRFLKVQTQTVWAPAVTTVIMVTIMPTTMSITTNTIIIMEVTPGRRVKTRRRRPWGFMATTMARPVVPGGNRAKVS